MKYKLSNIDVAIIIKELQKIKNCRLNNIYDLNNRNFLFKFDNLKDIPISNNFLYENKIYLNYLNGKFFYITQNPSFQRVQKPTTFVMKLREKLKNKRLTNIEQVGLDKIIKLTFGEEEYTYYIFIELFSQGNIILTDNNYKIITLIRWHDYDENNKNRVGYEYIFNDTIFDTNNINNLVNSDDLTVLQEYIKDVKSNISSIITYLIDYKIYHILTKQHLEYILNIYIEKNETIINTIQEFLLIINTIIYNIQSNNELDYYNTYYIYGDNYYNYLNIKHDITKIEKFTSFNNLIDNYINKNKFYIPLEQIKEEKQINEGETILEKKLKNVNKNLDNKVKKLESKNNSMNKINQIIEENFLEFQNIYNYLKSTQNYILNKEIKIKDYDKTFEIISYEIKKDKDINSKFINIKFMNTKIIMDINKKIYECLSNNYKDIKSNNDELEKTNKGRLIAEKNIKSKYSKENSKYNNKKVTQTNDNILELVKSEDLGRKYWFTKYNWCISNKKYLIISGKNIDHNEELYKKYLTNNDIYLHADFAGSPSCIVKDVVSIENSNPQLFIKVLEDANHLLILKSKCWNENFSARSYWVYSNQVSKTTESGEYITKGSFIIRGKKNYLSNVSMELGVTLYFQYGENLDNIEKNIVNEINNIQSKNKEEVDKEDIDKEKDYRNIYGGFILNVEPYRCCKNNKFNIKIKYGTQKRGKMIDKIKQIYLKKSNDYEKILINNINKTYIDYLPTNIYIN